MEKKKRRRKMNIKRKSIFVSVNGDLIDAKDVKNL